MSAFECHSNIKDCVRQRNDLAELFKNNSRLQLPLAFINEGLHGGAEGGTIFPMPVNQGASWNTSLVSMIARIIATEASALGVDFVFAPVVNMMTDPRFGRLQEGFSENPTITAHMGHASTVALQGGVSSGSQSYLAAIQQKRPIVASLAKHFAG